MKALSRAFEEAAKREAKRQWYWSRREIGFCDKPKWRLIAERLRLPLPYVVAFVNRLEEVVNDAGNKGYERGDHALFDAAEFGMALGMSEEEAARIFAALEENPKPWIADGHVADFYERNKDKQDDTAALRQRRSRARRDIFVFLGKLERLGLIERPLLDDIVRNLKALLDERLFELNARLQLALSTRRHVTRDSRDSRCDIVTVTLEKSINLETGKSGDNEQPNTPTTIPASGSAEAPEEVDPTSWLESRGKDIVTERMDDLPDRAALRIDRWLADVGHNAQALVQIIQEAERLNLIGPRYHNIISDQIRRYRDRAAGPQLPLMPPRPKRADFG